MAGFLFRVETTHGAPAAPPSFSSAVQNWAAGETIHFGKTVRVVAVRDDDADQPPVLVVEDVA